MDAFDQRPGDAIGAGERDRPDDPVEAAARERQRLGPAADQQRGAAARPRDVQHPSGGSTPTG
jgi:hypothetical protein